MGTTPVIAASTVAVIAARDMDVDTALVGTVGAAVISGAALGASLLAALMARRGRRVGLSLGYAIAVAGGIVAAWSVLSGVFLALIAGSLLIGFANSSSQLSRYASAEMAEPERRAGAISLVVWAATVGAVLGPAAVPFSAAAAEAVGLDELSGPFLVPAVFAALAAGLLWRFLRPDPDELAVDGDASAPLPHEASPDGGIVPMSPDGGVVPLSPAHGAMRPPDIDAADRSLPAAAFSQILRRPAVTIALVAMIVGQVVMVVIMAMTPLHMSDHGHGLGAIGIVISAHVLGMFALSPVSGRIADRVGSLTTILLGSGVLATAAIMAAVAPADDSRLLLVALFLLGYGWNLGFVAGSALLTSGLRASERTTAQGYTDSIVWASAAVASLAGGVILAVTGYQALGMIGLALLVLPVWTVVTMRGRVAGEGKVTGVSA